MSALLGAGTGAAYHVVLVIARLLTPLTGGLATAAAIIVFTAAARLLMLPLSHGALRGQASQARMLSQASELRRRYARQPERLRRELAALTRRERSGMLAGCLPLLVQLPLFSILYRLFRSATVNGRPNGLLGHALLGAPLGSHWLSGPGPLSAQGLVFAALFLLLGGAGWACARASRWLQPQQVAGTGGPALRPGIRAVADRPGGRASAGATRFAAMVLPYATIAVAAAVPLAAGFYLLVTTAWTAGERLLIGRRLIARGWPGPQLPGPGRPGRV